MMLLRLADDLRQLKAYAVLLLGIVVFAGLVAYHSGNMLKPKNEGSFSSESTYGVVKSMHNMVIDEANTIKQDALRASIRSKQTEAAAGMAKRALGDEHNLITSNRVTAIIVFQTPGMNLNLALRSIAKRSFVRELLLVHDLGPIAPSMPKEWTDAPKDIYGKPAKYLPRRGNRKELLKFDACATETDPRNTVCYYQSPTRDSSKYLESLYASFLRAPSLLHTSVGATTLYSGPLELSFKNLFSLSELSFFRPLSELCFSCFFLLFF